MDILIKVYTLSFFKIILLLVFFTLGWFMFVEHLTVNIKRRWIVRGIYCVFLIGSIWMIWFVTLGGRTPSHSDINLIPLYSIKSAQSQPEYFRIIFMNVILFYPFGMFLSGILDFKWYISIIIVATCGIMFSFGVEYMQYHQSLGIFEIDDIIFNTFGTVLGYVISIPSKEIIQSSIFFKDFRRRGCER